MAWVIDTGVVLDVAVKDPKWGFYSALFLERRKEDGFAVAPVTVIEITPVFGGRIDEARKFLRMMGCDLSHEWQDADTESAAAAWARYVAAASGATGGKRPVADILIGAFASRFQGLITRVPERFEPWFPGLTLISPILQGESFSEPPL